MDKYVCRRKAGWDALTYILYACAVGVFIIAVIILFCKEVLVFLILAAFGVVLLLAGMLIERRTDEASRNKRLCGKRGHEMDGCVCARCGETIHTLSGCRCAVCGADVHEFHDSTGAKDGGGEGRYVCARCGAVLTRFYERPACDYCGSSGSYESYSSQSGCGGSWTETCPFCGHMPSQLKETIKKRPEPDA